MARPGRQPEAVIIIRQEEKMDFNPEAGKENSGSPSLFLELADPGGEASFTIPVTIQDLQGDVATVKVDPRWTHLAHRTPAGQPAQLLMNLGVQEPLLANGKVAWLKELGLERPLFLGLELTQASPEVREAIADLLGDTPRDTLQLWERWDRACREKEPPSPNETFYQVYLAGLGIMFFGFALPLMGLRTHPYFSYLLIILGGLACSAKNILSIWTLRERKAKIL